MAALLQRVRRAFRRLAILPFETLIGGLALVSGFLGMLHIGGVGTDAVSLLLPGWMLTVVQAIYFVSGGTLILGIGLNRRAVEGFGLVTLATSTVIREVALIQVAGLNGPVLTGVLFNVLVLGACATRLRTLGRREVIIRARIGEQE